MKRLDLRLNGMLLFLSDSKADSCHFSVHRRDFDDENNFGGNYKGENLNGLSTNLFAICYNVIVCSPCSHVPTCKNIKSILIQANMQIKSFLCRVVVVVD